MSPEDKVLLRQFLDLGLPLEYKSHRWACQVIQDLASHADSLQDELRHTKAVLNDLLLEKGLQKRMTIMEDIIDYARYLADGEYLTDSGKMRRLLKKLDEVNDPKDGQ